MIQANELRIGNWVAKGSNWYQLNENNFIEYLLARPEPIPITPEILEKAGFEKSSNRNNTNLHKIAYRSYFPIDLGKNIDETLEAETYYYLRILIKIKSLHQLQNLYFELIGEELQISL